MDKILITSDFSEFIPIFPKKVIHVHFSPLSPQWKRCGLQWITWHKQTINTDLTALILWKTFFGRKTSWKNADKLAKLVVLRKLIHEWELYKK